MLELYPSEDVGYFFARLLGHLNHTDELVLVFLGLFTANLLSDHLEA